MRVPLLIVAALALLIAACGDAEEEAVQLGKADSPSPAATATTQSVTTPTSTADTREWQLYSYPGSEGLAAFSFSYPSEWFLRVFEPPQGAESLVVDVFTWDEISSPSLLLPDGEAKVELVILPANTGTSCPDNINSTLGGVPATFTEQTYDQTPADSLARVTVLQALKDGYCFSLTTFQSKNGPDAQVFSEISDSFDFGAGE